MVESRPKFASAPKRRGWSQEKITEAYEAHKRAFQQRRAQRAPARRQPARRAARVAMRVGRTLRASPRYTPEQKACITAYAVCKLFPFDEKAQGACIPEAGSQPSWKVTTRGFFNVVADAEAGKDGVAIAFCPTAYSGSVSGYSPMGWIHASTSGASNSTFAEFNTQQASTYARSFTAYGSPFTQVQFVPGKLMARCVGAGLQIYNRESPMHTNGDAFGLVYPGFNYSDATEIKSMQDQPQTRWKSKWEMTTDPFEVTFQPSGSTMNDYINTGNAYNQAQSTTGFAYPLAAYVPYSPTSGSSGVRLRVRTIAHFEVRGSDVNTLVSENFVHPQMKGEIDTAISAAHRLITPGSANVDAEKLTILQDMLLKGSEYGSEIWSWIAPYVNKETVGTVKAGHAAGVMALQAYAAAAAA